MSESIKLKDDNYWDSTGIIHNKKLLSDILEEITTGTFSLKSEYSFKDTFFKAPYLRKSNKTVHLNANINCENNVPTSDTIICNLPSEFRPCEAQILPIFLGTSGDNGWTFVAVGWGLIETNGNIHIRNATGTTYKYVLINTTYFTN